VRNRDYGGGIGSQCIFKCLLRFDLQMISGLVQQEKVGVGIQDARRRRTMRQQFI
jgi:hypothetical protein